MKSADRAPTCELNPGICLTTEKKARKNLSQGSQRMLLPITKTPTQLQYPPYTHPQYYKKPHTSIQYSTARCARNMYRLKNKNKYIEKNCASRWSYNKNHYMMHGQQNIKYLSLLKLKLVTEFTVSVPYTKDCILGQMNPDHILLRKIQKNVSRHIRRTESKCTEC